ncbi:hypothetical protein [Thermogemmatispora carboxidivorans]|uniref:hypothetical protein n=1 Tax=Thermogemmatispora carboxidivorans TaxID=1382306 RepID=UPI001EE32B1F|nr:hypothetical protein [Thermogemmatispora carboxidivorans]
MRTVHSQPASPTRSPLAASLSSDPLLFFLSPSRFGEPGTSYFLSSSHTHHYRRRFQCIHSIY